MSQQLSQEELGQKLLSACNVLYSPNSNSKARKAADEWLNNFRCTSEAWEISHHLLSQGSNAGIGQEVLFFAAQTLHTKIRSDFEQLPTTSHGQLCQSIIQHVCSFSAGPRNVLTKLCLALSALAIRTHSSDLWVRGNQRDVIGTLIDTFVSRGDPQSIGKYFKAKERASRMEHCSYLYSYFLLVDYSFKQTQTSLFLTQ